MGVWSPQALWATGCLHGGCLHQRSRVLLKGRGRGSLESELAYDRLCGWLWGELLAPSGSLCSYL